MKKFVVFSYPRTGSTLLVKTLNNLKGVVCQSEIFHQDFNSFKRAFIDREFISNNMKLPLKGFFLNEEKVFKKLFRLKNHDFHSFLKEIYQETTLAMGFKIFPGQHDEAFNYLLGEESVYKVILERENRLRSYVSEQISFKTGKWDRYTGEEPNLVQIDIDVNDFLLYKERIDGYLIETEKALEMSGQKYLKLTYEKIFQDVPYKIILDFLDILEIIQFENSINQERQNPFSLEDMILNYRQVKEALTIQELQHYLDNSR
ncbi:hypothetical protein [Rhodohalobacter sp. 614A]|uniref:hypothetical protein n=1 Tax=Rhodohalobacter sp. 614A TaxID=2908649 RepID=UPI001F38EC61|nr:hypothetical protein [Rhodohalobacter sp. 614A]